MQRFWFFGVNCLGFLKLIVQVFFVCFELTWVGPRRVGVRRVGVRRGVRRVGSNPEKVGPRRVGGPKGGGPKGGGPKGGEAQNFVLFFPCPAAKFVLFFPLWGSSRGILVVFEAPGALKCAHFRVPVFKNMTKPKP